MKEQLSATIIYERHCDAAVNAGYAADCTRYPPKSDRCGCSTFSFDAAIPSVIVFNRFNGKCLRHQCQALRHGVGRPAKVRRHAKCVDVRAMIAQARICTLVCRNGSRKRKVRVVNIKTALCIDRPEHRASTYRCVAELQRRASKVAGWLKVAIAYMAPNTEVAVTVAAPFERLASYESV